MQTIGLPRYVSFPVLLQRAHITVNLRSLGQVPVVHDIAIRVYSINPGHLSQVRVRALGVDMQFLPVLHLTFDWELFTELLECFLSEHGAQRLAAYAAIVALTALLLAFRDNVHIRRTKFVVVQRLS